MGDNHRSKIPTINTIMMLSIWIALNKLIISTIIVMISDKYHMDKFKPLNIFHILLFIAAKYRNVPSFYITIYVSYM